MGVISDELKSALQEVRGLSNATEYSLRVASHEAGLALDRIAEDPSKHREVIRKTLASIQDIFKPYLEADPNLKRISDLFGREWVKLRPGPRFERNPVALGTRVHPETGKILDWRWATQEEVKKIAKEIYPWLYEDFLEILIAEIDKGFHVTQNEAQLRHLIKAVFSSMMACFNTVQKFKDGDTVHLKPDLVLGKVRKVLGVKTRLHSSGQWVTDVFYEVGLRPEEFKVPYFCSQGQLAGDADLKGELRKRREFSENASANPILLPGGDVVPGALVHQWAVAAGYSREFAEEMEDELQYEMYAATRPEEPDLFMSMISAKIRTLGSVFFAKDMEARRAAEVLRERGIVHDIRRFEIGSIVWVPKAQREEARRILAEAGYPPIRLKPPER